ncbi:MAG TPA: hypothetical protein VGF79_15695 [Bacteroidia bacterium]
MPWLNILINVSASDIVFSSLSENFISNWRYVLLLLPISGIIALLGVLLNNGKYILPPGLLFILPLLSIIVLLFVFVSKVNENGVGSSIESNDALQLIKTLKIGFWISLICSIIFPFIGNYSELKEKNANETPYGS